ncbi:MAG: BON domain-containing protein [Pyrinomonadaceae bacterium]
MNKKLTGLVIGTALSAIAFSACEPAPTANGNKTIVVNSNTAVVTNNNANVAVAGNSTMTTWDANMTNMSREDYEKNKDDYAARAKKEGATIGSGAEDAWLWTKTRAALATTNDLRETTINVDVQNSVVTLKGTVGTKEQMMKAGEVAKGVKDVKSVTNDLKVAPADSMGNMSTNSVVNGNMRK